jgi:hypothetical protein
VVMYVHGTYLSSDFFQRRFLKAIQHQMRHTHRKSGIGFHSLAEEFSDFALATDEHACQLVLPSRPEKWLLFDNHNGASTFAKR